MRGSAERGSTVVRWPAHWTAFAAGIIATAIVLVLVNRLGAADDPPDVALEPEAAASAPEVDAEPDELGAAPGDAVADEPVEAETSVASVPDRTPCQPDLEAANEGPEAAVEVFLGLVEDVRDGLCPDRGPEVALCLALSLSTTTDPVIAYTLGIQPPLLDRMVAAHEWTISEVEARAIELGLPEVAASAAAYAEVDLSGLVGADEAQLYEMIALRATPEIVDGLAVADGYCGVG